MFKPHGGGLRSGNHFGRIRLPKWHSGFTEPHTISVISDKPQYCNKNVAIPKAISFNYQLGVLTNLRGINTICATYNVPSFVDMM